MSVHQTTPRQRSSGASHRAPADRIEARLDQVGQQVEALTSATSLLTECVEALAAAIEVRPNEEPEEGKRRAQAALHEARDLLLALRHVSS